MTKSPDQWRIPKTPAGRNVFSSWLDKPAKTSPFLQQTPLLSAPLPDQVETVFSPFPIDASNWARILQSQTHFPPISTPLPTDYTHPWQAIAPAIPTPFPDQSVSPQPETETDTTIQTESALDEPSPETTATTESLPSVSVLSEVDAMTTDEEPPTEAVTTTLCDFDLQEETPVTHEPIHLSQPAPRQRIYADLVRRSFGSGTPWLCDESIRPTLPTLQLMDRHHPAPVESGLTLPDALEMETAIEEVATPDPETEALPSVILIPPEPEMATDHLEEPLLEEPLLEEITSELTDPPVSPAEETAPAPSNRQELQPLSQVTHLTENPWSEEQRTEIASSPEVIALDSSEVPTLDATDELPILDEVAPFTPPPALADEPIEQEKPLVCEPVARSADVETTQEETLTPEALPVSEPSLELTMASQPDTFHSVPVENLLPGVANALADVVEIIVRPVWSMAAPAPAPLRESAYLSTRMGGVVRTSAWNVVHGFGAILSGTLTMVTGITGCVTRSVHCVVPPVNSPTRPAMQHLAT